jgi:hypothetical protein
MLRKITATVIMAAGLSVANHGLAQAQCSGGACPTGGGTSVSGYGAGTSGLDSFGSIYGHATQPLFDNYFTRGYSNGAEAAMYVSPIGVPGWVGHTYNTYQPLYPHQFLYQHHDRYHSYYDQGMGLNRTSAHYYAPPVHTIGRKIYKKFEIPR